MEKTSVLQLPQQNDQADRQVQRLAELVRDLTGCTEEEAVRALKASGAHESHDDALDRVARAIIKVRQ